MIVKGNSYIGEISSGNTTYITTSPLSDELSIPVKDNEEVAVIFTTYEKELKIFHAPEIEDDLREKMKFIHNTDKKEGRKLRRTLNLMFEEYKQKIRDSIEIIHEEITDQTINETKAYKQELKAKRKAKKKKEKKFHEESVERLNMLKLVNTYNDNKNI